MGTTGFQFIHLEAYARKADSSGRSVAWVLDEAARESGACPHVSAPAAPQVIFGLPIAEVRHRHDEACAGAKAILANGKSRAISSGQKTLLTVVASHPATIDSVRANPAVAADVAAWESRTVEWLRAQYGDSLLSVVRHTDEAFAHIHAYVLPGDLRAMALHPGTAAKRAVTDAGPAEGEDAKALNRRGDVAYKAAMREWQDSYHDRVGVPSGLARLGPGRRRLSRDAWLAEKSAATATKLAIDRAVRIGTRAREHVAKAKAVASTVIATAQEKADAAKQQAAAAMALQIAAETKERQATATIDRAGQQAAEAKALRDAAEARERKASIILDRAGSQATRIVAQAELRASRISSWGGRLRALWDGLRKSAVIESARRAAAQALERERARADEAARRVLEEAARRREAEQRARTAAESLLTTARERDQARQELAALRPAAPALDTGRRFGR